MIPMLLSLEISKLSDPSTEVVLQENTLKEIQIRAKDKTLQIKDLEELLRTHRKIYAASSIFDRNVRLETLESLLVKAPHANTAEAEEDFV